VSYNRRYGTRMGYYDDLVSLKSGLIEQKQELISLFKTEASRKFQIP